MAEENPLNTGEVKIAEVALREAVAKHGTTHPEVLVQLERYIALLHKAGDTAQAAKLEERARLLRQMLAAAAATSPAPVPQPEPAPSPAAAESGGGLNSLLSADDSFDSSYSDDDALELEVLSGPAGRPADSPAAPASASTPPTGTERHLFNSHGEHIATESDGFIYDPVGKNLGRWNEDLGVYIDKTGWYLGQVVEEDRLAKDKAWQFRHINFGDKGNAGDRTGWDRLRDTFRIVLPPGFEDVKFCDG